MSHDTVTLSVTENVVKVTDDSTNNVTVTVTGQDQNPVIISDVVTVQGPPGADGVVPTGTISGSEQFTDLSSPFTGSFTGSFAGDGSNLTGIGTDTAGLISGSIQVDHNQTTNYTASEHFTQDSITTVGTVTSGDVSAILPSDLVSSSAQFADGTDPFSGSFSGSFYGDGSGLSGVGSAIPDGTVSGSIQVDHNTTTNFSASRHFLQSEITELGTVTSGVVDGILPVGIISGSDQFPSGVVSGSIQIDHNSTANYSASRHFLQSEITELGTVTTGNIIQILPSGTVSGSVQVNYPEISNLPTGIISGSEQLPSGLVSGSSQVDYSGISGTPTGLVSGSSQVDHNQTTNYSASRHFLKSEINLGDLGNVDTSGVQDSYGVIFDSASGNYVLADIGVGASGSISDGANVGTGGIGVFKQKSGVTLQFKTLNSGSGKITLTDDTGNDEVDIDVDESQISFSNIADTDGVVSGSTQVSYTDISNVPLNLVSSSVQFDTLSSPFTGSFTGSFTGDGTGLTGVSSDPDPGTVSGSIQIDHNSTTNYSASRHFLQSEITEVGTVTSGDVSGILPLGTISGSSQVDYDSVTNVPLGIVSGSSQISYTGITNVPSGIISGAAQLPLGTVSGSSQVDFDGISNKPTLVSGSAQISYTGITNVPAGLVSGSVQVDHNSTTNYSASRHFLQSEITTLGTVTVGSVDTILPLGTFSGSSQVSYTGISDIPSGLVSGSSQVDFSGIIGKPTLVSGSAQISYTGISDVPVDIVSSSAQFDSLSSPFTGSFTGSFKGDGSQLSGVGSDPTPGTVSGSIQVDHNATTNYSASRHFLQSEITTLGTVSSGDVSTILPAGTVSGSVQVDYFGLNNLPSGIWSGSDQLPAGTVSGSSQVSYTGISNVPSGIVSGSDQINSAVSSSVVIYAVSSGSEVTVGDGAAFFTIPANVDGKNLTKVHARVVTAGTTGTTDIQIRNVTDSVDMLSTLLTIDSGETGTDTADTPYVINTSNDDVAEYDLLAIDVDAVSTTAPTGLIVSLTFS